jgi:hypothetical protein
MRQDYVQINRAELEEWLKDAFGSHWSRDQSKAGIYFIELSDRVAVKLSSTQKGSDSAVSIGRASMKLSLVSLADGSLLNAKAKDRKHFKRTINWKDTWKKGVDHWVGVYNKNPSFYEKIADRKEYKKEWLGMIDSIPMGGSDQKLIGYRDQLEGGGVLWDNQEDYIFDLHQRSQRRQPNPQLTQPLPVDLLRKMWVEARRQQDSQGMESLKDLGQASARGEIPSMADLIAFKSLKKELGF